MTPRESTLQSLPRSRTNAGLIADPFRLTLRRGGLYSSDIGVRGSRTTFGASCTRTRVTGADYRSDVGDLTGDDLRGSHFKFVDLTDAEFNNTDLTRARFRECDLTGVEMRAVDLIDVTITGDMQNLVINGVDVAPFVEAELDRRDPDRVKMRPTDAEGFQNAWGIIEHRWSELVERARGLDPGLLHQSVNGEWSFIETLRHLVFATNAWVRRAILGDASPWSPLDLPWDGMADTPGVPRDREVRPSLDEVLALRRDRMDGVRDVISRLTDESLARFTEPVEGPGWPPPKSFSVRQCLRVVLNEEWLHRQFAERDLDVLVGDAES